MNAKKYNRKVAISEINSSSLLFQWNKKMKIKRNRTAKLIMLIVPILIVIGCLSAVMYSIYRSKKPSMVLEFIQNNPEKVSLTILDKDNSLVQYQADRKMPLASVAKIIIAIEYARQAAEGKIDPNSRISLKDINCYYIPKLDGDAQPQWEEYLKQNKKIESGMVTLKEVAKGMIDFSSNANMEYLIELLGLEQINKNLTELQLTTHEAIYPFYASLLIPGSLMEEYRGISQADKAEKVKARIKDMPQEEFIKLSIIEHNKLKTDKDGSYLKSRNLEKWYDMEFDRMNSDRMVGATSREYGELLGKLNSNSYFSKEIRTYLREVMEGPMKSEGNQELFNHLGFKGGSTNYILNTAMYAMDKKEQTVEIAFFTNNLTTKEFKRLSQNMNDFIYQILTDKVFRLKVRETLG
jgi:D-alanyl-D-alanine carboxypeptidase